MRWIMLVAGLMAAGPVQAGSIMEHTRPWPKGEVPYRFTPDLLKAAGAKDQDCTGWRKWRQAQAFQACKAMDEWQVAAGVRFYASTRIDAITIKASRDQTSATVGRLPAGNTVNIEKRASYGSVLHEFGHSLGLMHEHQRPDRDMYISLSPFLADYLKDCGMTINAVCNDVRLAFPVLKVKMSSPYDPCSLMHYLQNQAPRHREDPRWSRIFTLTGDGKVALKACLPQMSHQPERCRKIGQKCTVSKDDAATVRRFNLGA
jgi:hypothetical protein